MTDQEPDQQGDEAAGAPGTSASADLGQRFLARLIDGVLLWLIFVAIIAPIIVGVFNGSPGVGAAFGGFGVDGVITGTVWAAFVVGYFTLMESFRGRTVGKILMKLKTQGPDGEKVTLEMAFKRNIWYALIIIPIIGGLATLGVVIYITMTISQSQTNTGWHDTFAGGTVVIETG
ncbi:MAG: hypothetical protein BMS9Abin12_2371 [Acidimicrobiia bacterium]|nr:MAG: hypothetical protein BMS9Abin12_2371 [Acidimicrobiia bacterium]